MAIPSIAAYPLPSREAVTPDRVDWQLDPARCALLIHDMQNYFIDAYEPGVEPISVATENIVRLRAACHQLGIPVVYTMQPGNQHPDRRGILADFWGEGMMAERDVAVVDALALTARDIAVTKWRYSAFQRTDLRELLAHSGRDQLIVTGVYAHMGCLLSVADAFMNDIQPFLVCDATADFTRAEHEMALDYAAKRCGRVDTTAGVLEAISR